MTKVQTWFAVLALAMMGGRDGAHADDPATVGFEKKADGLQIRIGDKPFARYVTEAGPITRPFLDQVHAPGGAQVTRNHPPVEGRDLVDHPTFHPGIWQAFGDLNGADSWRNNDRIRHAGFVEEPRGGSGRGGFAVRNHHEKDGGLIGEEICRLTIMARPAGSLLIWDSEFHPKDRNLVFGDQEEMGLGIRAATNMAVEKGGRLFNDQGQVNEAQVWGNQAAWCSYSGTIDGHQVGIMLMPDPGNFRRSWFHARNYGLLVANPFGRNAFTRGEKSRVVVKAGEELRLRYGVLVYDVEPGATPDLDAAYRDFLEQLDPIVSGSVPGA